MERYKNILCISYPELVRSEANPLGIMSGSSYKYYCSEKRERPMNVVRSGGNGRIALVEYDTVPLKYRQRWELLHGDPRDMKRQANLVDRIAPDHDARRVYEKYRYGEDNINLKEDVQEKYSRTAEIFNALTVKLNDMIEARQKTRQSMRGAWTEYLIPALERACAAYQPNDIPKHPRKIKEKYEMYIRDGYYSLIHSNFGNKNRSKLEDKEAIAAMLKFASKNTQLAATTGCEGYNAWAVENGREPITSRTFLNYMEKYAYLIKEPREGEGKFRDEFEEIIQRERPSAPLLLVNSDDNNLDFFFRASKEVAKDGKVRTITTDYYRYKMYLVLDAYCDYPLGYALGDEITTELVVEAYRNAANHVKELTGGHYLWHQIVADRWNYGNMKTFFEKQAKATFAQVGNAKSKYIERFFGVEWHEEMKRFGNHSGYNITAKKKPNPDWIAKNAKNFPTKAEGVHQIAKFIERLRNKPFQDTGKTRKQLWIETFFKSEKSNAHAISDQRFLSIFLEFRGTKKVEKRHRLTV